MIWEFIKVMFAEAGRAYEVPYLLQSPADRAAMAFPVIFIAVVAVGLVFIYGWVRDKIRFRKRNG